MTKSDKIISIFLMLIFILGYFSLKNGKNGEKRIRQNHSVYCGTIMSVNWGRGGYVIIYQFTVNEKIIESNGDCSKYTAKRFENGSKDILVVTEKSNPKVNRLLESSSDFEKFNISPSDTLGLSCLHDEY